MPTRVWTVFRDEAAFNDAGDICVNGMPLKADVSCTGASALPITRGKPSR